MLISDWSSDVCSSDLFRVESYPTVHQMISTVTARIRSGLGPVDVLSAIFPCGSITGAPKLRAMEIIDEIEAHPRGAYTGSMGWIDYSRDESFNVAIRKISGNEGDGRGQIGIGTGMVADTDMQS